MEKDDIKRYLQNFKGTMLDARIRDRLAEIKQVEVENGDQAGAKDTWCLEQVYKIVNHYVSAYSCLKENKHFDAWNHYDRADIEFSFLKKHLDYTDNKFKLLFIYNYIPKFQKLFPYQYFMSRESIVKSEHCSVCGQKLSLRQSCGHHVGEIYNGEQCFRVVDDLEFLGMAIVKNPFDKYTVLFPQGMEYNYHMLDKLVEHLDSPFEKWDLRISKELRKEYRNIGRNKPCPCNSGEKYKKCCYQSGNDRYEHYRILFLEKKTNFYEPVTMINTWK
ncbi:SEC-C domain-containing protein [Alicyclobacillus acidoterrestris]|uniref:SEC-C domain-containing protein n=1 Tax=Alicyclobacillus acidoterrestris (strain ATCC 49025 / DSM 3922 / CIP 106132 / NCIMB 13137 / GD3B) TaxID=1356854 RepID=T0C002_ALIAG|nr:SEC-C metal-binding domain-containing protein [Alicyclobacillus acidoterrestris]EPZ46364.1 hypothetical protein N007_06795 [Alicyclobacillus acidoterrestris ATCC 49025]UNO48966.1 SEC-C domain-containing protein [Alicyclobacillus acidoterrestris]